jgi:hypothetical protein
VPTKAADKTPPSITAMPPKKTGANSLSGILAISESIVAIHHQEEEAAAVRMLWSATTERRLLLTCSTSCWRRGLFFAWCVLVLVGLAAVDAAGDLPAGTKPVATLIRQREKRRRIGWTDRIVVIVWLRGAHRLAAWRFFRPV